MIKALYLRNKTETMQFTIREGEVKDVELIHYFIGELASFEKLSDQFTATVEELRDSLFVRREAEVLLGYEGETPVGFALFFHNFSTFKGRAALYLEDIYILPKYRGKGYGKELFKTLITIAKERNCPRFDWVVLDWNSSAIEFYKRMGASVLEEWRVCRISI